MLGERLNRMILKVSSNLGGFVNKGGEAPVPGFGGETQHSVIPAPSEGRGRRAPQPRPVSSGAAPGPSAGGCARLSFSSSSTSSSCRGRCPPAGMEAIEELAVQPCTSSLYLRPFRLSYRQVSGAAGPPARRAPSVRGPSAPPAPFWSSAGATSWSRWHLMQPVAPHGAGATPWNRPPRSARSTPGAAALPPVSPRPALRRDSSRAA